jgi:hypothetical protein
LEISATPKGDEVMSRKSAKEKGVMSSWRRELPPNMAWCPNMTISRATWDARLSSFMD